MTAANCVHCGARLNPGDAFCTACGKPVAAGAAAHAVSRPLPARRGSPRLAWWLGGGALALVTLGGVALINFNLFMRLVSIAGILLMLASVGLMLVTFRRPRKVSPISLLISMGMSLVCLAVYSAFMGAQISGLVILAALACGALIGAGWSLTTHLIRDRGVIKSQGNVWYLAVWALMFSLTQLIAMLTGRPPAVAMVMLVVGTGLVVGQNVSTLARFFRMRTATGARG
jgi:hypothetical protein